MPLESKLPSCFSMLACIPGLRILIAESFHKDIIFNRPASHTFGEQILFKLI